jgi:catechol 2,3-dioxygenase-like lactoylglutathione lyase family enzyme
LEKHWAKSITLQLYTSNLKETIYFYSVILGFDCDEIFDNQVVFSFNTTSFIFSVEEILQNNFPYKLNIEVEKIEQLWDSIHHKVHVYSAISDTKDGNSREFVVFDNNNNYIRFYEKNPTKQLNIDFYKFGEFLSIESK